MTKPREWPVRPANTQISLGIRPDQNQAIRRKQRALFYVYATLALLWNLLWIINLQVIKYSIRVKECIKTANI